MKTLLEQSGIAPNLKHPGKTKDMIEEALDELQADGVIGKFGVIVDGSPEGQEVQELIDQRARYWWDHYSLQQWYFHLPDAIKEKYVRLVEQQNRSE